MYSRRKLYARENPRENLNPIARRRRGVRRRPVAPSGKVGAERTRGSEQFRLSCHLLHRRRPGARPLRNRRAFAGALSRFSLAFHFVSFSFIVSPLRGWKSFALFLFSQPQHLYMKQLKFFFTVRIVSVACSFSRNSLRILGR